MQIRSALRSAVRPALHGIFGHVAYPSGAILHFDATKNKPLLPVTYNGKYLVVKNV